MIDDRKKKRCFFTKNRKINQIRFRDVIEFANMKNYRELIALKFSIDNKIRVRKRSNRNYIEK